MTVIGFTADGDVIANDPASPSNEAVRRVYQRREWENIWLRTKRYNADRQGRLRHRRRLLPVLARPADAAQRAALGRPSASE